MRRIFFICIFTTKSRPVISVIYCLFLHLVQRILTEKKKIKNLLIGKTCRADVRIIFCLEYSLYSSPAATNGPNSLHTLNKMEQSVHSLRDKKVIESLAGAPEAQLL